MAISFDLIGKRALVTGANTGIGQAIAPGDPLARVHAATEAQADAAIAEVQAAYRLGAEPVAEPPLILQRIT